LAVENVELEARLEVEWGAIIAKEKHVEAINQQRGVVKIMNRKV